jgi:phage tail sheath protein FI
MNAFIGVNIREVDGSAPPTIVAAPTSVAAFNIQTSRGAPNRAIFVDSFARFVERFGSYFDGGLGPYMVKGFFDNGGKVAYINRVVSTDPATGHAASEVTLQDGTPADTLRVLAGYRGAEDPGSWGDDLRVSVTRTTPDRTRLTEQAAAAVTGGAVLAAPVDMSTLPPITLRVDGETADRTISFLAADFPGGAATATPAQIRDAINGRQSAVVASLNVAGNIVLTSTGQLAGLTAPPGGWTSVEVRAANAALGLVAAAAVFGTPTAVGASGATLRRTDAFDIGDAVEVTDGVNAARVKLMSANPATGAVTWSPVIAGIGGWTARNIGVRNLRFTLTVAKGGDDDGDVVETWTGLSMETDTANYAETRINDALSGSKYIMAEDLGAASAVGLDLPANTAGFARLVSGRDGTPTSTQFVGDEAARTGFHVFDAEQVQLLTCERTDPAVVVGALAWCQNRGDCIYVGSTPEGLIEADLQAAIAYGQAFQGKNVYGALYGPWITISDPAGVGDNPMREIPATGHVMGVYARIDGRRGVWKAPAGDEANIAGALSVTQKLTDAEHTALVKSGSINGIRAIPRSGIVVDASRTLSTDTRWQYVNVRLLFNFVKSSLRETMRGFRQEPNRSSLWNTIKFGTVTPFLLSLWRQRAFGTGNPEEVFTVICDATNNPPSSVDAGILNLEVYFYPSRPAETIIITVGQQAFGGTATES